MCSLDLSNGCSSRGSDTENSMHCQHNNCSRQCYQNSALNHGCGSKKSEPVVKTAPAAPLTPRHLRDISDNGFNFSTSSPKNSISSSPLTSCSSAATLRNYSSSPQNSGSCSPSLVKTTRVRQATKKFEAELLLQQHRRSFSENIIHFPLHTTPSDKARCHQMQRQRSSTHSPTPPPADGSCSPYQNSAMRHSAPPESPVSAVLTLRKVAETMCLKDVQYQPIRTDHNGVKTNPFTALAQLRGVKKILGANPKTYAAGIGDLFSSCFEMTAPFFKELAALQKNSLSSEAATKEPGGKANNINSPSEPKSLPASPQLGRKLSAIELKIPARFSLRGNATLGNSSTNAANEEEDDDDASEPEQDNENGGNCADAESSSDDSAEHPVNNSAAVPRKYRANSLYTHPLFRGSVKSEDGSSYAAVAVNTVMDSNSSEDGCEENSKKSCNLTTSATAAALKDNHSALTDSKKGCASETNEAVAGTTRITTSTPPPVISNCTDYELMPSKSTLTRRDSIESGFYSCFNEESDAAINNVGASYRQQLANLACGSTAGSSCCFEQLKSQLLLETGSVNNEFRFVFNRNYNYYAFPTNFFLIIAVTNWPAYVAAVIMSPPHSIIRHIYSMIPAPHPPRYCLWMMQ